MSTLTSCLFRRKFRYSFSWAKLRFAPYMIRVLRVPSFAMANISAIMRGGFFVCGRLPQIRLPKRNLAICSRSFFYSSSKHGRLKIVFPKRTYFYRKNIVVFPRHFFIKNSCIPHAQGLVRKRFLLWRVQRTILCGL